MNNFVVKNGWFYETASTLKRATDISDEMKELGYKEVTIWQKERYATEYTEHMLGGDYRRVV